VQCSCHSDDVLEVGVLLKMLVPHISKRRLDLEQRDCYVEFQGEIGMEDEAGLNRWPSCSSSK
jgi:hypothetical protein